MTWYAVWGRVLGRKRFGVRAGPLMAVDSGSAGTAGHVAVAEHLVDRLLVNVEHGRFERSLSGLTAAAALA